MTAAPLLFAAALLAPPGDAVGSRNGSAGYDADAVPQAVAGRSALSVAFGGVPRLVWNAAPPAKGHYLPLPKPYVFPLYAPGGANLLDVAPADHLHHRGLWIAVDEVELHAADGTRFGPYKHWVEQGRIETAAFETAAFETAAVEVAAADPAAVRWAYRATWHAPDGTPVLEESTAIAARAGGLIEYEIALAPPASGPARGAAVTIGDTKEGFLALRVAPWLNEKRGTGRFVNSEGGAGERGTWGRPAAWVDLSGTYEDAAGETHAAGVALFDHPSNLRPARYHARGYGLFSISPFGPHAYSDGKQPKAPVTIPAEGLTLRYAVFPHAGDAETGGVAAAFAAYASGK